MKRLSHFVVLALLLAPLAALAQSQLSEFKDGRLARIVDPLRVELHADAANLGQVISIVAPSRDWKILSEAPGRFELTRTVAGKHMMKIDLAYDARGYTIRYVDSANLLYDEKAQSARGWEARAIHKNYNVWIRDLASSINSAVGAPAVAGGGQPRTRTGAASSVPAGAAAALPERIDIVPPAPGTPAEIAAFSGVWSGTWGATLHHALVVERIEGRNVDVVYGWGTNSRVLDPGYSRHTGTIGEDGVLRMTLSNGVQVRYRISADGSALRGEYERNGRVTPGNFEKVSFPSSRAP